MSPRTPLIALALAAALPAQGRYDYHPHVGDLHPSVDVSAIETSNGFNVPDGVWNNGEGFGGSGPTRGVDTGGMGELDDGSTLVIDDVHVQLGWSPHTVVSPDGDMVPVYRMVGFLYPKEQYDALSVPEKLALDGLATKSAFEIFVPEEYDPGRQTVVVMRVMPTITGPSSSDPFNRFQPQPRAITGDYSGQDFNLFSPYSDADDGLSWNPAAGIIDRADTDRMAALSGPASNYNIITAYIVPPDNDQHGMLTIQRTLQLTKALQFVFDSGSGALWPGSNATLGATWNGQSGNQWPLPVVLAGGSNGGLITQFMTANFPDVYCGGVCIRMGPSLRVSASAHEIWEYISAAQAAGNSSSFHRIQNVHPLTAFLRSLVPPSFVATGGMYARGDALHLWLQGEMARPLYMLIGDEDTVYNGESSLWRLFEGTLTGGDTYHPCGAVEAPIMGKGPAAMYWSISEKSGHEPFAPLCVPASLSDTGSDEIVDEPLRAMIYFLDEAIASWTANPTMPRPDLTTVAAPPASGNSAYDSMTWVLNRFSVADRRFALPSTTLPGLLTEDTSFIAKHRGLGAFAGMNESLVPDSKGEKIFVGSADGVISVLGPLKDKSLGILDQFGSSTPADPKSFGYAVRGIAENGNWIAVALQRRIMLFERGNLQSPVAQVNLSWEEYSPKNFQMTKGLFGGSDTHLVYSTHLGELVVRKVAPPALSVVAWSSQPSIESLVVSDKPGVAGSPPTSRKMYMSTEAGHLVELCMSRAVPSTVTVTGVSNRVGTIRDLVMAPDGSVAGIVHDGRLGAYSFMNFRRMPNGILVHGSPVLLDTLPTEPAVFGSAEQAYPPRIVSYGDGIFVVLAQGVVFVVGGSTASLVPANSAFAVELNRFPAGQYAGNIAVQDVDQDGKKDLLLATENGQVAWLPASALLSGDMSAVETAVLGSEWFPSAGAPKPLMYSSGSVTSTWGMAWGVDSLFDEMQSPGTPESLQVVDQSGRRWAIEEDGTPRYLRTIKDSENIGSVEYPSIRRKPFRDLAWIGTRAPSVLQSHEACFDLGGYLNPAKPNRSELYRAAFWQSIYLRARNPGLWLERYDGTTAGLVPWFAMRPDTTLGSGRGQPFDDGYLPFAMTGDTMEVTGAGIYSGIYGFYWNGTTMSLPGVLRGFRLDATNPLSVISTPWGSSSSDSNIMTWTLLSPPPFPNESSAQAHLRHLTAPGAVFDAQSLRIGKWDTTSPLGPFPLRAVVSTMGGRIIVNNPDPGIPLGECVTTSSEDHGLGGLALHVADVHGNDLSTIFFGTIYTHEGHFPSGSPVRRDTVASLHIYRLDGTAGETLVELDSRVFDGSGSDAKLFGLCGIATGNLVDDADGIQDELILTTLNGDLVVYDLDGTGESVTIGATPLYWQVFDGALGVSNSIVIRDPQGGKDTDGELYVGSTMGIRKFTFTP